MPRVFEDRAKALLNSAGVRVPKGHSVTTPLEAAEAARAIGGPVMVKALVPAGKRGKAGAILAADTPDEAEEAAKKLLGRVVHHFPVKRLLVEERVAIAQEWYLSVAFDSASRGPLVMFSAEGGVEIESLLEENPDALRRMEVDILEGLSEERCVSFLRAMGVHGEGLYRAAMALEACYALFRRTEARVLEVNPLVLTDTDEVIAAACVLDLDADALFRHADLKELLDEDSDGGWRPPTPVEARVAEIDASIPPINTARFTEIEDGEIALMWSGGGGGLYLLDTMARLGGKPATAFDITPGPLEEKYFEITKEILAMPNVKGALAGSNITSFSRVQLKVRAIARAVEETGVDLAKFPFIVRFAGAGGEEAREIAAGCPGLQYLGDEVTLEEAAERIIAQVEAVKRGESWMSAGGAP
ncbi:MAG: acetate--CoA ligase family protein [Nitrospinae bacterium]|nr:acetate--CoA ligase family protein [Nitrospinota bacterium]